MTTPHNVQARRNAQARRKAQARRNVQVKSRESQFDKAMEAYKQVSNKYRNALRELAK